MAFDVNTLDEKNTPWRWRRVGAWLVENEVDITHLHPFWQSVLTKSAEIHGAEPAEGGEPETVAVTGVTISGPSTTDLAPTTEVQLVATVAPANADNQDVTWESSNTDAATVSEEGLVTAVATGTATITVTTDDGDFTATREVTVA